MPNIISESIEVDTRADVSKRWNGKLTHADSKDGRSVIHGGNSLVSQSLLIGQPSQPGSPNSAGQRLIGRITQNAVIMTGLYTSRLAVKFQQSLMNE